MSSSAPHTSCPDAASRVTLGLALGGGAARGLAHLGILKVLERHGLRPDLVAGTSIGAVVGGLWVAGKLDELMAWALPLNRHDLFGFLDVTLNGGGLIAGRRLMARMRREVGALQLENLPLPFTAVATECGTGHETWLSTGDFVSAIRASYAVPGIFTPAHVDGRWLMDGALVNPVPVSPARAGGADVIIAVDLTADALTSGREAPASGPAPASPAAEPPTGIESLGDLLKPERLRHQFMGQHLSRSPRQRNDKLSLPSVILDAFTITQNRITRARLAEDPPEVLIVPRLRDIGLFDFHRGEEAMAIGIEAAEQALPQIRQALAQAAGRKAKGQTPDVATGQDT